MTYTTLISSLELAEIQHQKNVIIFDCRFDLTDTEAGAKAYRHGHIENARYADLDKDLSSAITDFTGRHPLPNFKVLIQKLSHWGVTNHSQVIVYDDIQGAYAGRLWWLLRCLGHEKVAVLEGGLSAWLKQGYPITTKLPKINPAQFRAYINDKAWLTASEVETGLAKKSITLIDARTQIRYRGEYEPVDKVAGHIPYAINHPYHKNLDDSGHFLKPEQLRQQFKHIIGERLPEQVVHSCGSGVTACHNLLAMEVAGLKGSKLYAGSWSDWITNKNRAVETFG